MLTNKVTFIENDPNITSLNDRFKSRLCTKVESNIKMSHDRTYLDSFLLPI